MLLNIKSNGNGYFAVKGILSLETILPCVVCDWSILMMYQA